MMTVTITIECGDNAVFGDPAREISRILQRYVARLRERWQVDAALLYDQNGNQVGAVEVSNE